MEKPEQYALYWRRLRLARGLTQQALADVLGIRFQFISAVERGDSRYSTDQVRRLTRKYKLNVDEMVDLVMRDEETRVRAAFRGSRRR